MIKINALHDWYWHSSQIAMVLQPRQAQHRRSTSSTRTPPRRFEKLIASADVVMHNMRYPAAVKLGIDYDSR